MKYIDLPHQHKAATQAFSCFAETQLVDFTKGQKRDDVSFYKKLARFEQAKEYGIDEKEFERLLRLEKTGKYVLSIGPSQKASKNDKKQITVKLTTITSRLSVDPQPKK